MNKLLEGLREGDLQDLCMPLLSIDEFESKIDDGSIVVGFYVNESDPAKDLNRFIQKGCVPVLDTDVAPAPTKEGYYMVFVEIPRDDNFPKTLIDLVHSLKDLVKITKWSFKAFRVDGVKELDLEALKKFVRLEKKEEIAKHKSDDKIKEFFKYSFLDGLLIENNNITLACGKWFKTFKLIDYGNSKNIYETYKLSNQPMIYDDKTRRVVDELYSVLGKHWLIYSLKEAYVVQNPKTGQIILLA